MRGYQRVIEAPERSRILEDFLPQRPPFRFVDELLELDREHVLCKYTFRDEEFFYPGHFPGEPITPGVILIETMAQGVALHAMYLLSLDLAPAELARHRALLADAQVEFQKPVYPRQTVYARADLVAWRRKKLRSRVELRDESNQLLASGVLSGMGVAHV
jgi:3-hydroxyacyl-[acyl-carrier-protein] dehydratase